MYKFKHYEDRLDSRSNLANRIFKLIYQKHNGNLVKCIEEARPFIYDLEETVRNIYELKYNEIPFWAFYELHSSSKDKGLGYFGFTPEEFDEYYNISIEACHKYYK